MPRNNNRKTTRQLSKTEIIIQQEQQEKRLALRQQRHREYLARQQRRDNKSRKQTLRATPGYKPTWMIIRDQQRSAASASKPIASSFCLLENHDQDQAQFDEDSKVVAFVPKPCAVQSVSLSWAHIGKSSADCKKEKQEEEQEEEEEEDDAWPELQQSNWADEV